MSPLKLIKHNCPSPFSVLASALGTAAGMTAAAAGGWILYSNLAIDHAAPLPKAIDAERKEFSNRRTDRLSYYVSPQGMTPLWG